MGKSKSTKKLKKSKKNAQKGSASSLHKSFAKAMPEDPKKAHLFDDIGVFRIVYFSPFLVGSLLAGGVVLDDLLIFSILLCYLAAAFYTGSGTARHVREDRVVLNARFALLYGVLLALLFSTFSITRNWSVVALMIVLAMSMIGRQALELKCVRSLFIYIVAVIVELSLFCVLGAYGQTRSFYWSLALLGFTPGCVLGAYIVLKNVTLLTSVGWLRRHESVNAKGRVVIRPLGIARLFAILLMIGPAIMTMLSSLKFIPVEFFWSGLALILTPSQAASVMNQSEPSITTERKVLYFAGACSLLMLVLGWIAAN